MSEGAASSSPSGTQSIDCSCGSTHPVLADSALVAFATDDDYTFGVLHSRAHEVWVRVQGTQVREVETGFRYTPTTCFDTFPFPPDPKPEERARVGEAARRLVELRDGWLNPPNTSNDQLATRTLTNLYNQRPSWLVNAHEELDAAVFGTYRWPQDIDREAILSRLLELNLERAVADSGWKQDLAADGQRATVRGRP